MKRPAENTRYFTESNPVSKSKAPNVRLLPRPAPETKYVPAPVLLCIGLHPSLLKAQRATWKSAGCVVTSASTIPKAIVSIAAGDFDLVLLGERLPVVDRERLTLLIRSMGFGVPIVCIADRCGLLETAALAIPPRTQEKVFQGIGEVIAGNARTQPVVTRRSR